MVFHKDIVTLKPYPKLLRWFQQSDYYFSVCFPKLEGYFLLDVLIIFAFLFRLDKIFWEQTEANQSVHQQSEKPILIHLEVAQMAVQLHKDLSASQSDLVLPSHTLA